MDIDHSIYSVWDWIPQTELYVQIFSNLDSKDLLACAQVNRKFYDVISKNETVLWKGVCAREWARSEEAKPYAPELEPEVLNAELCGVNSWKEAWKKGPKGFVEAYGKAMTFVKNDSKPEYLFFNKFFSPALPAVYFTPIFRSQLRRFYMDLNDLVSVPKSLGSLARLTFLDLSHNKLTHLPAELAKLTGLEVLDISYNQFKELNPVPFASLSALKTVRLAHNQLTTLPVELSTWTKLKTFSVGNNPMPAIPKVIFSWSTVERLQIGGIPFTLEELKEFPSLSYLYVDIADIEALRKRMKEAGINANVDKERKELESKN